MLTATVLLIVVSAGIAVGAPRNPYSHSEKVTRQAKQIGLQCNPETSELNISINGIPVVTLPGMPPRSIPSQCSVTYDGQIITYCSDSVTPITNFTSCTAATLETVEAGDMLPGGGMLYINLPVAFYTTVTEFFRLINEDLNNCVPTVITYSGSVVTVVSSDGSVTSFSEPPTYVFDSQTLEYSGSTGTVTVGDTEIIATGVSNFIIDAGGGITSYGSSETVTLPGGGLLFTTSSSSTVVYTTDPTIVPSTFTFTTISDNQGATYLVAVASSVGSEIRSQINVLNITISNQHIQNNLFPIDDYTYSFQNGMLIVMDSSNQIWRIVERVEQIYYSDASGCLRLLNENEQVRIDGGYLYTGGTQAFITNQQDVINLIAHNQGSRPSFQYTTSGSSDRIEIELLAGGESVVSLTDSSIQTIDLVNRGYTIIYDNNTIYVINSGLRISTPFMYTASNIVTEDGDTDPRLSGIADLCVYDGVDVNTYTGSSTELFQGGGVLYRSGSDGFYVANTDPLNSDAPLHYNPEELLMKVDIIYEMGDVKRLQVYDESTLATNTEFSRNFIEEDGRLYVAGNNAFFSSSFQQIREIAEMVLKRVPVEITIDTENLAIDVTVNNNSIVSILPLERLQIKHAESFIFRNNTILYADSDVEVFAMVTTLTVYDGISTTTYSGSAQLQFKGQGVIYYDALRNIAFYVKGVYEVIDEIDKTVQSFKNSLRKPVVAEPLMDDVLLIESVSEADFGQDVKAYETANVTIFCHIVDGFPPPSITFTFKGSDSNLSTIDTSNSKYTVAKTPNVSSLTIVDINADDEGVYSCIAENLDGITTSETSLTVKNAVPPTINPGAVVCFIPQIHQQIVQISSPTPVNVTYNIISEVYINCDASGRPKPDITWFADGVTLAGNAEYNMTTPIPGFGVLEYDVTESLSTTCVDYECRAENGAGEAIESVTVCGERYSCTSTNSFTDCSATCGAGYIVEIYECQKQFDSVTQVVGNYSSIPRSLTDIPRPAVIPCGDPQPPPCPTIEYRYNYSDYGPCSVTCGRGIMQRTVDCVEVTRDGQSPFAVISTEVANDTKCIIAGQVLEETIQSCQQPDCPVWRTGEYGSCSVTCGRGIRMRPVECVQPNSTNVFNDTACDIRRKPNDVIVCDAGTCPFLWGFSAWGECVPDCELGYYTRNVSCYDTSRSVIVDDEFCSEAGEPPANISRCGSGPCQNAGSWLAGRFSDCSVNCGVGEATRTVTCVDINYDQIESIYCNPEWKPQERKTCFLRNCPGMCVGQHPICVALASINMCGIADNDPELDCCISCS